MRKAILKWVHTPLATLAQMWSRELDDFATDADSRPPVFTPPGRDVRCIVSVGMLRSPGLASLYRSNPRH